LSPRSKATACLASGSERRSMFRACTKRRAASSGTYGNARARSISISNRGTIPAEGTCIQKHS